MCVCLNIVKQHIRKEAANYDRRGALLHINTDTNIFFIALGLFALFFGMYILEDTDSDA